MSGYDIDLTPDDGSLLVTCAALPEVTSFGEDETEARRHAVAAIAEALAARIAGGRDLPPWDEHAMLRLPTLTVLKADLYRATRAKGVTRAELVRRLGWPREQVERLFRIDHKSRLDQIEAALEAIDLAVDIRLERLDA